MRPLKIFIWNVHGSYLYYLTQAQHEFYVPFKPDRKGDYIGRYGHIPWGNNVHDVPVDEVKNLDLDCIIFQQPHEYLHDQFVIFSKEQQKVPKIYLQHAPPLQHPTDTKHFIDDPNTLIVHVTPFNQIMWDTGRSPTCVIEHGVMVPPNVHYIGELEKGIVVINHLKQGGRQWGQDIYEQALGEVPLDLIGMDAEEMPGGFKEVLFKNLFTFKSHYRFFFNPVRYSGFPLALCEAMMVGLPIITVATTEMATVVQNDVTGFCSNRVEYLINYMKDLLRDPEKAKELGQNARKYAEERFSIRRFVHDWNNALSFATAFSYLNDLQHHTAERAYENSHDQ